MSLSSVYSPEQIIPCLDKKLPLELHGIIGTFLGYKHHFYVLLRLSNNSLITPQIKKYICTDCYPYYKNLKNDAINYDVEFEKMMIENIHNIAEIHKVLPLFYKKSKDETYITSNEHIKMNELLTKGLARQVDSDDSFEDENENPLTCVVYHVYRIHHFPIIREITRSQFVIAFLAQTINFHFKRKGEKKQLHFQAYYKIPSYEKINKHIKKLRCKLKKQFVLVPAPGRL